MRGDWRPRDPLKQESKAAVGKLAGAFVFGDGAVAALASMQFREGASVAIIEPVGSPLFPAVAVAIRRQGWRVLWCKIDIFGDTLQIRVH